MAALAIPPAFAADTQEINTQRGLSDAELGHLRNFVSLARQDMDDWSGWEGSDQKGMEAYRYQIAFMTYALALQQYHSTPAYRDLYQDTMNRLIERMLEKPVWDFWEEVSKSSPKFDPDYEGPRPSERDPVGKKNIMYSGHVVHMIALHEMLFDDERWSQPGAITFRWNSDEAYAYDLAGLVDIIHEEMMAPRLEGGRDVGAMECEPNLVFPECNQHPTLAFMLFDDHRDTDYAERTIPALKGFFDNTEMHSPRNAHTAAYYYVKQDRTLHIPMVNSASADGWTGAFMHVWDPDTIEGLYPKHRDDYVKTDPKTGATRLAPDPSAALGLAFFANLAVEVGDMQTAEKLFAFAEEHYASVTDERGFRYMPQRGEGMLPVNNTTDKLMALARSNRPDGLLKMHNEPRGEEGFAHPLLQNVDFPNVMVRSAYWDEEETSLNFTLTTLDGGETETSFEISNLGPGAYELFVGGESVGGLDRFGQTSTTRGLVSLKNGNILQVPTTVGIDTQFSLRAHSK